MTWFRWLIALVYAGGCGTGVHTLTLSLGGGRGLAALLAIVSLPVGVATVVGEFRAARRECP